MKGDLTMRCRECGLELDARDRLPNGAYQCPECGAINHTAMSSRVSPSPWRRKRKTGLAAVADALTQRRFGLPLWGWLAVALAVLIALIIILNLGGGKDAAENLPDASEAPGVEATVSPDAPLDQPLDGLNGAAGASSSPSTEPSETQLPESGTALSTGVAVNDFTVGFDWAMSKLKFTETLTLLSSGTNPSGEPVNSYSFQDWYTLQLVMAPNTDTIRSATATVQLEPDSKNNNLRALAGLAATVYSIDNSVSANAARKQLEAMVADNSAYYDRENFTGRLASSDTEYTLTLTGKR